MTATVKSQTAQKRWQTQLPVDYLDATLVINTWETVRADLSEGEPAKLWLIVLEQTNNGAAAEDLELEITINGTAYTWSITAASGTMYYCFIDDSLSGGDFATTQATNPRTVGIGFDVGNLTVPFMVDTVGLIRVRQTTAVDGVSAQIEVNIIWEKKVDV
jgi:hypothetical protein